MCLLAITPQRQPMLWLLSPRVSFTYFGCFYKWNHVCNFLHLVFYMTLIHAVACSCSLLFFVAYSIPLYKYFTIYLFILLLINIWVLSVCADEALGKLSQYVLLWHVDYFELKRSRAQKTMEEHLNSHPCCLKEFKIEACPRKELSP